LIKEGSIIRDLLDQVGGGVAAASVEQCSQVLLELLAKARQGESVASQGAARHDYSCASQMRRLDEFLRRFAG
jgi:hypothetical protein